jgi:hypothetical protein
MIVMHLILLGVAYLALEEISQSVNKSRKLCVPNFLLKRLVGLSYSVQTEITLNTHFFSLSKACTLETCEEYKSGRQTEIE